MKDYIRSKDYRKFIEENGVIVSDWDKATLIYHAPGMSHTEKTFALLELKKRTEDPNLQRQITERLDRDHRFYEAYKQCNGNAYYKLSVPYEGRYSTEGIYLSFEAAYLDGKKEGDPFRIEKALLACKKQAGDTDGVFGAVEFDEQGYLHKKLWLYEKNKGLDFEQNETGVKNRFEDRYVDLPLLYRQGDIVHIVGTDLLGIVDGPKDDAEEEKYCDLARKGDYSDFQVAVNLMFNGNKYLSVFSHEHVCPTELEYATLDEGDPRKGFLEYIKQVLYERESNTLFSGTGRKPERIREILTKIEIVWKQYPDMRLGQLLLNVCGNCDFFSMEDEELLKRLQYNQFPIEESD